MVAIEPLNIEQFCSDLNVTQENLAYLATLRMYYHTYRIWEALKLIPHHDPVKLYADFWRRDAAKSFHAVAKALNISEVPNIKVLGEIVAYATTCAPSLYVTKISEPDLHVGYVTWCGNPGILKISNKTRFCVDDYIRAECAIELEYLESYIEQAKKMGLKDDVEAISNNPRCGTCFSSACQFILKKKNVSLPHISEEKFNFIDYQIGYERPLEFVLNELHRSYADQALMSVSSFFAKDLSVWEVLANITDGKVSNYYQLVWDSYAANNINELKLKHNLAKSYSREELINEVLTFGFNQMLIPCLPQGKHEQKEYVLDLSQFVRTSSSHPRQSEYLTDVVACLQKYAGKLLENSGFNAVELKFKPDENNRQQLIFTVRF